MCKLVLAYVVILAFASSGCRVVYPGDGHLVVVQVEKDLASCIVTRTNASDTTVEQAIREGLRYWDITGANLHLEKDLTPQQLAGNAPRMHYRGDKCVEAGAEVVHSGNATIVPAGAAQYNLYDGDVQIFLRRWEMKDLTDGHWSSLTSTLAHEAGHAIGLDHVQELNAVMNTDGSYRTELADADLQEFARVW